MFTKCYINLVATVSTFFAYNTAKAQQCLVCDAITRIPIREVRVQTDGKIIRKTTYLGCINLPLGFQSATFSKKNYCSETLSAAEIARDTVFLMPIENSLDEVTVWGKQLINADSLRKNIPYLDPLKEVEHGGFEFDFVFSFSIHNHSYTEKRCLTIYSISQPKIHEVKAQYGRNGHLKIFSLSKSIMFIVVYINVSSMNYNCL